jgi:hypothetical protein
LNEPKPWLTPKSDSLESFLAFVVRLLLVVAVTGTTAYLALADRLTAPTGTVLLAIAAGLLGRR